MNQPDYSDFMNDEECYNFESDMENGIYKPWSEKYPNHIISIFGAYINFYGHTGSITELDIKYFKERGVDLNICSTVYPSDSGESTPLGSACEFRMIKLMEILIKLGANVNLQDSKEFTPLDSAILGHRAGDLCDYDTIKECIDLLVKYNVKNELLDYIKDEFLDCIKNENKTSPIIKFLDEFVTKCNIRKSNDNIN